MISVLIPARNAAGTLAASLRSTLATLPSDAEVLLADDASSDDTWKIATSIADKRLTAIRLDTQHGVAAALNILLARATQPFVARMDSDDIVLPWRWRHQLQALQGGADLIFSTRVDFGASPASFRMASMCRRITPRLAPWSLLAGNPFTHSTLMARRDAVLRLGEPTYRSGPAEDYDLWMRAALSDLRLSSGRLPCIAYRRHSAQVTREPDWWHRYLADSHLASSHYELSRKLGWDGPPMWSLVARPLHDSTSPSDKPLLARFEDFIRHGRSAA
jgi:glycosyltransferase involved in cell wall biosynthesis